MGVLARVELSAAEELWVSIMQRIVFLDKVKDLQIHREVTRGPPLVLHPFLDDSRLIYVGGRLAHSTKPYMKQHSLIIPGKQVRTKHRKLGPSSS